MALHTAQANSPSSISLKAAENALFLGVFTLRLLRVRKPFRSFLGIFRKALQCATDARSNLAPWPRPPLRFARCRASVRRLYTAN